MTAIQTLLPRVGFVRTGAAGALIAALMVAVAAPASAHHKPGHWKGGPHGQPRVVYVQPQTVIVAPAPIAVVTPAPVVVAPQPVYVAPPPPVVYSRPSIDIVVPIHID